MKAKGRLKDSGDVNISGEKVVAILGGVTNVQKNDGNKQDTKAE